MPLPDGHRPITLKWVFKLKKDKLGAVIKHKARLVACGFVQQEGIDFDDAFAPVAAIVKINHYWLFHNRQSDFMFWHSDSSCLEAWRWT